jgi:hypothetical protein
LETAGIGGVEEIVLWLIAYQAEASDPQKGSLAIERSYRCVKRFPQMTADSVPSSFCSTQIYRDVEAARIGSQSAQMMRAPHLESYTKIRQRYEAARAEFEPIVEKLAHLPPGILYPLFALAFPSIDRQTLALSESDQQLQMQALLFFRELSSEPSGQAVSERVAEQLAHIGQLDELEENKFVSALREVSKSLSKRERVNQVVEAFAVGNYKPLCRLLSENSHFAWEAVEIPARQRVVKSSTAGLSDPVTLGRYIVTAVGSKTGVGGFNDFIAYLHRVLYRRQRVNPEKSMWSISVVRALVDASGLPDIDKDMLLEKLISQIPKAHLVAANAVSQGSSTTIQAVSAPPGSAAEEKNVGSASVPTHPESPSPVLGIPAAPIWASFQAPPNPRVAPPPVAVEHSEELENVVAERKGELTREAVALHK